MSEFEKVIKPSKARIIQTGLQILVNRIDFKNRSIQPKANAAGASWDMMGGDYVTFGGLSDDAKGILFNIGITDSNNPRNYPYYIERNDGLYLFGDVKRIEYDLEDNYFLVK